MANFIALDIETANADFASICSVGIVHFKDDQICHSVHFLVDPEDTFDSLNVAIHGIGPEDVSGKPTMADILPEIRQHIDGNVVVHHSHFDRSAVNKAARKYGAEPPSCIWLDTVRVARRAWPHLSEISGHGLESVAGYLNIRFRHHEAEEDARAAGLIFTHAMRETALDIDGWLKRVEQPVSGIPSGRYAQPGDASGAFFGETVVFTGKLEMNRSTASSMAAKVGCNVDNSVTKRTTILIVGDQDIRLTKGQEKSAKHRRAEVLIRSGTALTIVGESDFLRMIGQLD